MGKNYKWIMMLSEEKLLLFCLIDLTSYMFMALFI